MANYFAGWRLGLGLGAGASASSGLGVPATNVGSHPHVARGGFQAAVGPARLGSRGSRFRLPTGGWQSCGGACGAVMRLGIFVFSAALRQARASVAQVMCRPWRQVGNR